jgi:hypothetical protein
VLEGFHAKDFKALERKAKAAEIQAQPVAPKKVSGGEGEDSKPVKKPVAVKKPKENNVVVNDSPRGGHEFWLEDGEVRLSTSNAKSKVTADTLSRAKQQVSGQGKTALQSERLSLEGGDEKVEVNSGNRRAPALPYQLIAIMQDRAWVQSKDGTTHTVQEGEFLPNGEKILKIDSKRDEVRTSGGILK